MIGWPTWFANRRAGLHKYFWVTTRLCDTGQPGPNG